MLVDDGGSKIPLPPRLTVAIGVTVGAATALLLLAIVCCVCCPWLVLETFPEKLK